MKLWIATVLMIVAAAAATYWIAVDVQPAVFEYCWSKPYLCR